MAKSTANANRTSRAEERLDLVFGALADPTRRAILARIARASDDGATVSELAEPFAMSLPAVSKHLRVLEHAGLLARTIDGRVHRCSLDARPLGDAERWLAHYRPFWEDTLEALAKFVEARPAKPSRSKRSARRT